MTKRERTQLAKAIGYLNSGDGWEDVMRIINTLLGRSNAHYDVLDAAKTEPFHALGEDRPFKFEISSEPPHQAPSDQAVDRAPQHTI